MKRMLFTIPDSLAKTLRDVVSAGERSKFVVRHIQIPLKKLEQDKVKKNKKTRSLYKPEFLKGLKKAERDVERGNVYTHEHIMKEFGLL